MSSEAEARRAVLAEMSRWLVDDVDTEALIGGVARATVVLDNYKEQIERRVLAQQPCRMCHELPCDGVVSVIFRCCNQKEPRDRCDPCQARAAQTQETSG